MAWTFGLDEDMNRFTDWLDQFVDPSGREHFADDADDAMHPLVAACLIAIICVCIVAAITWVALGW